MERHTCQRTPIPADARAKQHDSWCHGSSTARLNAELVARLERLPVTQRQRRKNCQAGRGRTEFRNAPGYILRCKGNTSAGTRRAGRKAQRHDDRGREQTIARHRPRLVRSLLNFPASPVGHFRRPSSGRTASLLGDLSETEAPSILASAGRPPVLIVRIGRNSILLTVAGDVLRFHPDSCRGRKPRCGSPSNSEIVGRTGGLMEIVW